jgi:hypothetical protein
MIGLIPRPLHALLDYLWGIAFFAAPERMGFANNEIASAYCKARGGSMVAISLFTRFELGIVKVIPFNMHLLLDLIGALFGLVAPQLVGFDKNDKARKTAIAFSLFELGAVLFSKRDKK